MDLVANIKLAETIISEVSDFCIEYSKKELEAFGDEAEYFGTWDDIASQEGILFSPKLFKKYFVPPYKKIISNVKKKKIFFGWHCCGNVNDFLPDMIEAGIDVFDVVQTSAKDMNIERIYREYGKDICIHGGVDVQDELINGKPSDIRNKVKKITDLWGKRGGIIIAPSHETLPETPIENLLAIYN